MVLCIHCQEALVPDLGKHKPRTFNKCYAHTRESLQQSVEKECWFCVQFWAALTEKHRVVFNSPSFDGSIWCEAFLPRDSKYFSKISFRLGQEFDECGWPFSKEFSVYPPDELGPVFGKSVPPNTNDEACWAQIMQWLSACNETHTKCHSRTPFLPARLLDVSPPDLSPSEIRLITTDTLPPSTPYLALSHCWGTTPFLTTTLSTLPALVTSIPISSLPPNFLDAITTTRRLSHRYIWIDSLCIIQDSPTDWTTQAPQMHNIYKNASLTLAALASSSAFTGFFHTRSPDLIASHRLPDSSTAIPSDLWLTHFHESPLNTRAWVLQERLLAPRTLHFGTPQLFWECKHVEACETFPLGIPEDQFATGYLRREHDGFKRWEENSRADTGGRYDTWELILHEYTACRLTMERDKFVALSGVVKEFERVLGDEYLAGLWRGNFVGGLLWFVDSTDGVAEGRRPREWRAPSWSWASIDGPVNVPFGPELGREWVKVAEVVVVPRGGDATAEVDSAKVRLRGFLVRVERPRLFGVSARVLGGTVYPDVRSEFVDGAYYALPVKERLMDEDKALYGLLLRAVDGEDDVFERVGVFLTSEHDPLEILGQYKPEGWDYELERDWFDTTAGEKDIVII